MTTYNLQYEVTDEVMMEEDDSSDDDSNGNLLRSAGHIAVACFGPLQLLVTFLYIDTPLTSTNDSGRYRLRGFTNTHQSIIA
jgi:hypothetical protein